MRYSLVLSLLLAELAIANPAPVADQAFRSHQQALDTGRGYESQNRFKSSESRSQVVRRWAMEQAGRRSKPSSRSSSPGTQLRSSRDSSPLKLPLSVGSFSHTSSLHPGSRSTSPSESSRSSSETSWGRPPKDYNEAFRRLDITPPQSPRSRKKALQQNDNKQHGHLNVQHQSIQQGAPIIGKPKEMPREGSPSSQSSSASDFTVMRVG